jgi:hypothetical protein
VTGNECNAKHSTGLANDLINLKLKPVHKLVNIDFKGFYLNIPTDTSLYNSTKN